MSRSKSHRPPTPPELSGGLPESLTTALIASEFNIDDVLDEYVRAISFSKPAEVWQQADYHARVLVRQVLAQHVYGPALEQCLSRRLRDRLHAMDRSSSP